MSRRDYPNDGADLLAAVSAGLAVLKRHSASDERTAVSWTTTAVSWTARATAMP